MFGAVNLSLLINTKTLAQSQSDLTKNYPCIGIKIELYIRQAKKGSSSAFNKLVVCNSKSIPYLVKALKNKNKNLRIISIAALDKIDPKLAELPYLTKLLKDNNKNVRIIIVKALVRIGKDAVSALITALKDEDSEVRSSAAYALGKIGTDAKSAIPALIIALKDENSGV
ncbi:HEAT repeat domain-containing protein, partial [Calothrix rhizosoleniae]